jgi:hypothetical protein
VLYVVGSTALNKGDETVKARIERLGFVVAVKDGTNVVTQDADDVSMVMISSTANAANVNTKFRDVEVPVIVANSALFPVMGMTGPVKDTDYGDVPVETEIMIQNVTHPLSAGLKETVTVYDLAASRIFGKTGEKAARRAVATTAWGKPGRKAIKIAVLTTDQEKYTSRDKEPEADKNSGKVVIFAYELCEQMEKMHAPARRVGLFLDSEVASNLTINGWILFETAIRWAAGEEVKQFNFVFKEEWKEIQERRDGLYQAADGGRCQPPQNLVGLALSGGGIRSATFNLGLLQGLYDLKALRIFDYLSTVSGGGYLGGWWSAWLSREKRPDIFPEPEGIEPQRASRYLLIGEDRVAEGSMSAGVDPIHHLRLFANYLTPRKGILSADTWRAITVVTRNLAMTWLVLLPVLVAFVLAGQLYFTLRESSRQDFQDQLIIQTTKAVQSSSRPVAPQTPDASAAQTRERPAPKLNDILWRRAWFAAIPLIMVFGWMVVMVSLWMVRNNSGPWWLGWLGAIAVLLLILCGLIIYAPEWFFPQQPEPGLPPPAQPQETIWATLRSPERLWATIMSFGVLPFFWAIVAILLCVYALVISNAKRSSASVRADQRWLREVQRNKIIRVNATLLVILVVTAAVLGLSGFGHDGVEYILQPKNPLVLQAGGWGAIIAAIAGSIFTAVKGSPMGGGDQRVVSEPSLPSRIIFAITPPLVLFVLLMAASWVAFELLGFVVKDMRRTTPLTIATFVGIGLCFSFALYEMYMQKPLVQKWLTWLVLLFAADALVGTYIFAQRPQPTLPRTSIGICLAAFAGGLIIWRLAVSETRRIGEDEQRSFEFAGLKNLFSEDLSLVLLTVVGLLFTLLFPIIISSKFLWILQRLSDQLSLRPELSPLAVAVPIGLFLCALLVLVEMIWGKGNNRRALYLIAFPYLALCALLIVSFYPTFKDGMQDEGAFFRIQSQMLIHAAIGLLAMVFAWIIALGWMADPNVLSLHAFYKSRLVRAYLGASNDRRKEKKREITEAVEGDDVALKDLLNCQNSAPYHLINTTLNLVGGRDLATAQRSSAAFVLSKLYCGSTRTGYRETDSYMGGRLTLGAAVAISGAAVSPNMGSLKTSASLAMLMTLLNVRLGYWAPTPSKEGWQTSQARLWPFYLLRESLSQTNDLSTFCYLTDGGHFENTGLYSLVERGCRYIVLSDSAADPAPCFADLGNAVRRCRIDFRTEIELDITPFIKESKDDRFAEQHYTVGRIIYSEAHFRRLGRPNSSLEDRTGVIVYIKPALLKNEREMDADVRQYELENGGFPQQTTADQWFDEAQFESYRQLGYHCAEAAFGKIEVENTLAYREVKMKAEAERRPEETSIIDVQEASERIRNKQFTPADIEKLFNFFYSYKPPASTTTG